MKFAKRFLAMGLSAAMATGVLAGCGGSGGSSDSDPSTWQSIPSADFWAQCDSYEASFVSPGYTPFTNF